MDNERTFDVDEHGEKQAPPRPATGQPTPTAPLRHPGTGAPVVKRKNVPERRVRGSTAATGGKPSAKTAKPSNRVFFLFTPGFLLFLGAIVLAALWAGGLFADAGEGWPWDAFRGEDGQSWVLRWSAPHVLTILGAFFALFFLIASFFRSSAGRGMAVLTVAGLGLVVLSPTVTNYLLYVGAAFLGFSGGAVIARAGLGGGRGMPLVAVLLLAAVLFMPHAGSTDAYRSTAWNLGQDLFGEGGRSIGDVLLAPGSALVLMLCVLLAVSLLLWLGLGGAWALWVGSLALLLGVLGPLVLSYLEYARGLEGEVVFREAARGVAQAIAALAAFLAFALPVAAGVLDAGRGDRP